MTRPRREILQTKRNKAKRILLREHAACARRHTMIVAGVTAMMLAPPSVASALNEPVLRATFPAANAPARSVDVPAVTATFDRDLSLSNSRFAVAFGATPVTGAVRLAGEPSETGGRRTLAFEPAAPLAEGDYGAEVVACPLIGTTSNCTAVRFTFAVDDTPPPPATIDAPAGGVTTAQPVVARGAAEPGASIVIRESDVELARTVVASDGGWLVELPYGAEDGVQHTIEVWVLDHAGNSSAPTTRSFVHDSVRVVPVILAPGEGEAFSADLVRIAGTAKRSTSVRVDDATGPVASTTANADGRWSLEACFAEGSHVVTATSTDEHGTVDGPSAARTFSVDLHPPAAPVVTAPSAYVATRDVTIEGAAEPRAMVRIRHGGVVRASTDVDAAGRWSLVLTFTEGAHSIVAEAVDAAENVSTGAPHSFTVDTVPPAVPIIDQPAQDAFVPSSAVTVAGRADAGTVVSLFDVGVAIGAATTAGDGTWSVAVTLADGTHSIVAVARDAAGNGSAPSTPRSFAVDTAPPAPPVIERPLEGATLSDPDVWIRGTAEGGTTVRVRDGSTVLGAVVADGTGAWALRRMFSDGPHVLTADSTDLAGNVGAPSAPRTFTVASPSDATPPPAPVILEPAAGSVRPASVVVAGTAEPATTVRVLEGATVLGTATARDDGAWSLAVTLGPGPHTIAATASDAAGNTSPSSAPRSFTVDAQRPAVAFSASQGTVFVTGVAPVTLAGTASDDHGVARVDLEVWDRVRNTIVLATTAGVCSGCPGTSVSWSASPSIPTGVYVVRAYAVDVAGNRSAPPATVSIVVV